MIIPFGAIISAITLNTMLEQERIREEREEDEEDDEEQS